MAHDVFISHSSDDRALTDRVCKHLEQNGIKCWVSYRDLSESRGWAGGVMSALKTSKLIVLILSANSNSSTQVLKEIIKAEELKKRVIQFRIEDIKLNDDLDYHIGYVQAHNAFFGRIKDHFEPLVVDIRTSVAGISAPPKKEETFGNVLFVSGDDSEPDSSFGNLLVITIDDILTLVGLKANEKLPSLIDSGQVPGDWEGPSSQTHTGSWLGVIISEAIALLSAATFLVFYPSFERGPSVLDKVNDYPFLDIDPLFFRELNISIFNKLVSLLALFWAISTITGVIVSRLARFRSLDGVISGAYGFICMLMITWIDMASPIGLKTAIIVQVLVIALVVFGIAKRLPIIWALGAIVAVQCCVFGIPTDFPMMSVLLSAPALTLVILGTALSRKESRQQI